MRFYFDVTNGEHSRDDIGTELADRDEARAEALAVLAPIAGDVFPDEKACSVSVTVRDSDRRPIFQASLALVEGWID
ncbi:hypothetical protein OB2597_01557 [Pseudooceanicola batsensis HTCC2597]|uniref:DUF6894 domain-containing protein n=1 Tax=Pseudooceanicola batsensis (strain ATCC BAA-863 / DSM 15984 / KCTC 12145 / HTCC2597) TaxID=252305 RepID=A3U304_PSEBH|nr:hypothetical protein [Pseudooceanicola batsensis]EAQ01534.1 hypothetical protein OB2597_01557 [Pseudooceanicola batsensis HTCC2597]